MHRALRRIINIFRTYSEQDKELINALHLIIGYKPVNLQLFRLATVHSSVAETNSQGFKESNERLEYLGDAILGSIVAEYLFKKYPFKDEGFLTEIRSRIVNRESLNTIGRKLGLEKIIKLDTNRRKFSSHRSVFGDTLEALIGAVYLDRGYKRCQTFVYNHLLEPHYNIDEIIKNNPNYKSQIIEWAQKNGKSIKFDAKELSGSGNQKEFEVDIIVDDAVISSGIGPNKKKAEQTASRKAIESNLV